MTIIKKKIKNTTYLCEVKAYRENGKVKTKWKCLGKLDENGNLIPSKKNAQVQEKQEILETSQEVKALAVVETTQDLKIDSENVIEPEIIPIINEEKEVLEFSDTQNLPQFISKKAEQYKMGTTKIENTLFDEEKNMSIYEADDVKINVSRGNSSKKRIDTLLYVDFNDTKASGITISYEDRITPYDREVYNAVATLADAGNKCISPSMVFQLLSGNTSDERNKMSVESREKIVRSINKMSVTRVTIDASAEVKAGMIFQAKFENYLIPAKRIEMLVNGQRIKDGIQLLDNLPLFQYASKKNQIASIEVKMLDTPLANTPENIELKGYLLRRISSILNDKNNMSAVIRYDTLYDYLKIKTLSQDSLNHKRKQIRDKVKKLLEYWKKESLIKKYKEEKEGRCFAKVIIYC